jgi:hypothetical protein
MFTHGTLQRRASWMRRLAISLTLALGFSPIALLSTAAQAQGMAPSPPPVRSLLLFPASVLSSVTGVPSYIPGRLDDAIKLRLNLVGDYNAISYSKFLPSVQRALTESDSGGLVDADVEPPFDLAGAQKIAPLVGTDAFLMTTIESYTQDPTTRQVTILVNSDVYYSKTGDAVPGLGGTFSGTALPTSNTDSDADIQQGAINNVAARIVSSLNASAPQQAATVVHTSQRGSSKGAETVLAVVLTGLLAYAIINGSHIGGGGSSSSSTSTSTSTGTPTGGVPSPPAAP